MSFDTVGLLLEIKRLKEELEDAYKVMKLNGDQYKHYEEYSHILERHVRIFVNAIEKHREAWRGTATEEHHLETCNLCQSLGDYRRATEGES
jgi:hypothetical protein